ncbi:MAG: hypothetical protein JRI23_04215 [Deltaproteobacteria bacterium]|jgi:hypothetical protein|nr:hypothetical protein [Deltaproteobacteria bacterium]MBW2530739.1 hypothetical protein [Deltaproteobacteria bacterium]
MAKRIEREPKRIGRRGFGGLLAVPAVSCFVGGCRRSPRGDYAAPGVSGTGPITADADAIDVDLGTTLGPFHRLSGVQGSPVPLVEGDVDHRERYRAHHIEHARFPQDCQPNTLTLAAIFPDGRADPGKADSYHFQAIDPHLAAAQAAGAKVLWQSSYDVGRSDSWHTYNLQGRAPTDLDRWSRVVTRCLEHFNNRFAGGLDYAVPQVEFVNEPNGLGGFGGARAKDLLPAFLRFLETIERYNRAHPDTPVKSVGPGIPFSHPDYDRWKPRFAKLFERLRADGRRLDVFSFHSYGSDVSPVANAKLARALRAQLDEHGLKESELWNTEWQAGDFLRRHLGIRSRPARKPTEAELRAFGAGMATYALSCKIRWQGVLTGSYYYRANMRAFPPRVEAERLLRGRPGYALLFTSEGEARPLAFQESLTHRIAGEAPLRCQTTWRDDGQLCALGLCSKDGSTAAVLLCNLAPTSRPVTVRLTGLSRSSDGPATVISLDGQSAPLAEQPISVPPARGGALTLQTIIPPLGTRYLVLKRT